MQRKSRPGAAQDQAMSDRTETDIDRLKVRLVEERDELQRLVAAHHEETKPVKVDQTTVGRLSRMDEIQMQAMSKETERRRKDELSRVEAALKRIEDGEYGYCVACGAEVRPKRLELDPATPNCIDCATAGEGK
jgi:DnaK suppressor protein|tara:strand:- start:262 stop:663 length:402 start_codon:yes stop_codon:yes gene_type:complete